MAKWIRYGVPSSVNGQDAVRAKDWLTALSPLLLMMVVNYRWSAVLAVLTATAGYAAATVVWQWVKVSPCYAAPAFLCGVVIACCLPSAAPMWLAALAGLIGGVVAGLPALVNRLCRNRFWSCPVYLPALAGFLAVRFLFSSYFSAFAVPVMWASADAVASATPLAALGQSETATSLTHLFWGFDAGSMGGGPAPALLLGYGYLLLRRRLHPIPVAAMVGTVALASWMLWDMPLYGVLAGGTLLAAVLMGDEGLVHVGWKGRLAAGVTAGVVTVLCRLWWGIDGCAIGVLTAGLLTPVLHIVYHLLCHVVPPMVSAVCGFLRRFAAFLRQKFAKTEN